MQIRLISIFRLVAVIAILVSLYLWFARQPALLGAVALVQVNQQREQFEADFYQELQDELANSSNASKMISMERLRQEIKLKDSGNGVYRVESWGELYTHDRRQLRELMQAAKKTIYGMAEREDADYSIKILFRY